MWVGTADVLGAGDESVASNYTMAIWASEKGVPGDVFTIAQDLEGYLWLGGPTGLLRFDGNHFTPWQPADPVSALPSGPVHAIVGSPDGSIWVGLGGGGGVVRIHRAQIVRYSPSDGAPPGVSAMIQDRQGTIWVAARRGVFRFLNGRWTLLGKAEGYSGAEAFSLYEDRAGRLWAGTASGVYQWKKDAFELVDATSTDVQSLVEDASGAIWVTDSREVIKRLSTHSAPQHDRKIRLPTGAWRLMRDSHGQIWAAAFGGGLMRVRNPLDQSAIIERYEYEHRLAGSPRSLYEDREGNIWVGMRGGLLRLSESAFTSVSQLEGLTNEGVRTATVGSDGSVWVATGHGLNKFSSTGQTTYALSQTMALHNDRHGTLWVSAAQQVSRFVNGRFVPVEVPDIVRSSRVMAFTTDFDDTLWLCTALKGVMTWDGKKLTRFDGQAELADRACQSIYTDKQGRVWIGLLSGGVAVFEKGIFRSFGEREGLPRGTVLAILEDAKGSLWFSTSAGVGRIQNGRVTSITHVNAPLKDLVPVLVEDLGGHIWVGVNSGAAVIRFHPDEVDKVAGNPSYQLEYSLYDESDGMQLGSQTWQAGVGGVRGGDGRLWVATGLGMTVIDPSSLPPSRRPPPPQIEAVVADGRRISAERGLSLPARTSTLRIEFSSISLSSSSKLRFRYMLEGLDDEWVYAGNVREATYSNVPSGDYRFRVSTTANGEWTEAARWEFAVAPPFYRTREFAAFSVLGVMLVFAGAWGFRLRAVRNQYALVFAERARVSREIHDTLLQSLAAIGVELETIATQLEPSQDPAREGLRRLRRQVGHCLREARESILELRNNSMKPRALVDVLRELAEHTTKSKGIRTEFSVTGRTRACSGDADVQLLRIAQEAVANAVKHGRATQIHITLHFEKDGVRLTIADNGCGFVPEERDPAPASGEHLGLLTMRERAARLRGRLALVSNPGAGTTIEAAVPLAAE
ncbi:MAG TPA: two-component regulator propeller domain-containing protein [Vicinamibacterales bacterium]|nr:two-component regulator propeller domain-containing protein [Vicinamibacterales bacterium]